MYPTQDDQEGKEPVTIGDQDEGAAARPKQVPVRPPTVKVSPVPFHRETTNTASMLTATQRAAACNT